MRILGALFVILFFASIYLDGSGGCGGGGGDTGTPSTTTATPADGGTIQSSDGALKAVVPAGAVDADTTISVSELADAGVLADIDDNYGGRIGSVYSLGPDGQVFNESVTLTLGNTTALLQSAATEGRFASVTGLNRGSDGSFEALGITGAAVDDTADTLTVTATTTHFSDPSFHAGPLFYEITPVTTVAAVGDNLQINVTFINDHDFTFGVTSGGAVLDDITIGSSLGGTGDSFVTPRGTSLSFPQTLQLNESLETDFSYTCNTAGTGNIGFRGQVGYFIVLLQLDDPSGTRIGVSANQETPFSYTTQATCASEVVEVLILDYAHGDLAAGTVVARNCITGGTVGEPEPVDPEAGTGCACTHLHGDITIQGKGTFSDEKPSSCGHGCLKSVLPEDVDLNCE